MFVKTFKRIFTIITFEWNIYAFFSLVHLIGTIRNYEFDVSENVSPSIPLMEMESNLIVSSSIIILELFLCIDKFMSRLMAFKQHTPSTGSSTQTWMRL